MAKKSLHWHPHYLAAFASIALTALQVAACNGAANPSDLGARDSDAPPGHGGPGAGGGGGKAGGGDDGFVDEGAGAPGLCNPPCAASEICSVAGECIAPGTCLADGDCAAGTVCDKATKTCIPGGGCGGKEASAVPVAPNLLVVLDRSCSMTDWIGNGVTKWQAAVEAIQKMTTTFNGKIRFGLTLFPDLGGPQCEQGAIPVPVAQGNEAKIQALLSDSLVWGSNYYPSGPCVTNIDTGMQQATTEPAFSDADRASYALLITDGQQYQGCDAAGGDAGTVMIIADLLDKQGVSTFVLGFGDEVAPGKLNQFAEAGGVPASGATKYYDAQDAASLESALAAIADKTLGCTFALDEAPPDDGEIYVFFDDKTSVPRDAAHAKGWDYDPAAQQITFYGEPCELLKSGQVTDVDIVFGCPEPVAD